MRNNPYEVKSQEENKPDPSDQIKIPEVNKRMAEQYYLLMMTYIQTRKAPAYIKELIKHLQIIHTIIVYLLISEQPLSYVIHSSYSWLNQNQSIYRLIQIVAYLLQLSSIILMGLPYSERIFASTKTKIIQIIIKTMPLCAEAFLFLSSFLMTVSFSQNIVSFLISILIYFYCNVFMTNDTNRNGIAFITSSMNNLYFCVIFVFFYTSNCLSLIFTSQVLHEVCITFGALSYLGWYHTFGYKIYLNIQIQRFLDIFIAFILVIAIQIIEQKLTNSYFLSLDSVASILLTSIIVSMTILRYSQLRFERSCHHFESSVKSNQKLKQFELFLWNYQKQQTQTIESKSFLKGMMKKFQKTQKLAQAQDQFGIFTTKKSLYRNNDGQSETAKRSFDEILMHYIHNRYEEMLNIQQNKQIMIDYIDFMLNTSGNFYRLHLLAQRVKLLDLGILDNLKMTKISLLLKKNVAKFNNRVYQHLNLDEIMECEDVFHGILTNINKVIHKNIQIWQKIQSKTIDQTSIEALLKNIHQTIQNIDELWLKLTIFLKKNKKWLFIYLVYCLYIKNQRIKSDLLAQIYEDDSFNELQDISKSQIFNNNTFYLRCKMMNEQLRILKVSSNTSNLLQFSDKQLIDNNLNIILPQQMRQNHNNKVMKWLQKGQCNHERSYRTINSFFVKRDRSKVSAKIIFTLHIDYISPFHFQFVALLHVKMKRQLNEEHSSDGCSPQEALLKIDKRGQIVLDNRNNIFLKEKNLQPIKKHPQISFLKLILGLLVLSLLMVNFIYGITTYSQLQDLQGNSISYFNFLNLYRFPMSIGKNYMKFFLNLGNKAKVINQINVVYNQIVTFNQDPFTRQTIFDKSINRPAIYYPYINNSYNLGIGINQIDIFYEIMSNLASLSRFPLSIDRLGYEFTQFNMYIKPAYDTMLNGTKYRLNEKLGETINHSSDHQFIFASVQIVFISIVTVITIASIYRFLSQMEGVMKIIFQLEQGKIKAIKQYWKKFQDFFSNIKVESENYERSIRKARNTAFVQQKNQNVINQYMNKRQKQIKISEKHRKRICIFFVLMFVLFLGILISSIGIEFYAFANLNILKIFYNDGFYFLRFYPVTSTLGHATLQKYYSIIYPNETTFHPDRYQDTIEALFIMGDTNYIGKVIDEDSHYYQKQKNYLFSNPCIFDPSVMIAAQVTMAQCMIYNNKSFTNGIISYLRNIQNPVSNYLNGKANLTYSQLDQLAASLSLVTYYITDIIKTWSYEFVDRVTFLRNNIMISVGVASAITLFLYIMILVVVKNTLESAYNGVIYMLSYMMPENILLTEKITKQQLVTLKILKG